jgi:hypothetical protein
MARLTTLGLITATSVGVMLASAAFAQRPALTMLDHLPHGRWELHFRGEQEPAKQICLHDGRDLIQLRHPDRTCNRLVIEDSDASVTVQYTCRGHGYGRTHIRRETDRLFQVESQGVADGLPFDFRAEGRRIGDCKD